MKNALKSEITQYVPDLAMFERYSYKETEKTSHDMWNISFLKHPAIMQGAFLMPQNKREAVRNGTYTRN